jgi:hypothetical protein
VLRIHLERKEIASEQCGQASLKDTEGSKWNRDIRLLVMKSNLCANPPSDAQLVEIGRDYRFGGFVRTTPIVTGAIKRAYPGSRLEASKKAA